MLNDLEENLLLYFPENGKNFFLFFLKLNKKKEREELQEKTLLIID